MNVFFDTETCGLHGPIALIQWAEDDGEVELYSPWMSTVKETMCLLEHFTQADMVVGFNLSFDWFHVCQMYTTLALMSDRNATLMDCVEEYALNEPKARFGPCLKPKKSCDIMLHARKGVYQSTMDRGDIRIKRVPTAIVYSVARELEKRVPFKDIYFARRKDKHAPRWQIYDLTEEDGSIDENFKDIVCKFAPSSGLKALAADALGVGDEILKFGDIEPKTFPEEHGYAPFALSIGTPNNWRGGWPEHIDHHVSHWTYNTQARKYAKDDVVYTRDLWKYFDSPEGGDDDSELASMVGAVRWRGFNVNAPGLKGLSTATDARKMKMVDGKPFKIPTEPAKSRIYINQVLSPLEQRFLKDSTKKVFLEEMAEWTLPCDCDQDYEPKQAICPCGKVKTPHPVNTRAKEVISARQAKYEKNLFEKFISANRFHAAFEVIGALSSRMSGSGGDLNSQGIKRDKHIRAMFPLADEGFILCGGDFSSFEVTLADACYNDPDLRADLMRGKSIHGLFGVFLFPQLSYDEIMKSKGVKPPLVDWYDKAKRAFFASLYGGTEHTLVDRIGIDLQVAKDALVMFSKKYKGVGIEGERIKEMFCSMKQAGAIGSRITWSEPADYVESMFGFRRYFTLENKICKVLFNLASKPPQEWKNAKIHVQRRDRMQTGCGAAQSALYAAAFAIQASNTRAARNHRIQSSGATITKKVQRRIWGHQPSGVSEWMVVPLNVHDEIQCPCHPSVVDAVKKTVDDTVSEYREHVPLIGMDWDTNMKTWADKA